MQSPETGIPAEEQPKTVMQHLGLRGILLIVAIFFVLAAGVLIELSLRTDAPETPPRPLPSYSSSFVAPSSSATPGP